MMIVDIISAVLLLLGVFFGLTGAVGLFRFPDFFTRIHAASITDSMCAVLIIAGLVLQSDFGLTAVKLVFILLFLLVTGPTASHALAKAARHGGLLTIPEKSELPSDSDTDEQTNA
jgi:multicomponent Na+:H+ antiporter subunit G